MDGSVSVITWQPDLRKSLDNRRVYQIFGKCLLGDEIWQPIAAGETDNYRYFKVSVSLP